MFRPMRAVDAVLEKIKCPVFLFPKIDGVRGVFTDGLYARTMRPFDNVYTNKKFNNAGIPPFDSELTLGDDWTRPRLVNLTSSALMTEEGEPDIRVNVFDLLVPHDLAFHIRYDLARMEVDTIRRDGSDLFKMIPYVECRNVDEIRAAHKDNVMKGYEGSVLRDPMAPYKYGTSTIEEGGYLRLKDFTDTEGVVVDIIEGTVNLNPKTMDRLGLAQRSSHKANKVPSGRIGTLIVKNLYTGQLQDVSPGKMTHIERKFYFENPSLIIGKIIKYQFFNYGIKDKARFPTYQCFRDNKDIILPEGVA